jgi:nitric-oxide synthase
MKLSNKQIRERIEDAESLPMLLLEAIDYLRLFYQEQSLPEAQLQERLVEIYHDYR